MVSNGTGTLTAQITLADFLVEQYGKEGVSVDKLVREQQAKAKRNGRDISYDIAFEEMVADAMETMFTDKRVAEKMARLKSQDKPLWQDIRDFVQGKNERKQDYEKEFICDFDRDLTLPASSELLRGKGAAGEYIHIRNIFRGDGDDATDAPRIGCNRLRG